MIRVQPGSKKLNDPEPFSRCRGVAGTEDSAALVGIGGSEPAAEGPELMLEKVGKLIEDRQVMRPAHVLLPIVRILTGAELYLTLDAGYFNAPNLGLPVVAISTAENLSNPVLKTNQLHRFTSEDDGPLVIHEGQTDPAFTLRSTGSTAEEDDIRLTLDRLHLWTRQRHPLLQGEQRFQLLQGLRRQSRQ